MANEHTPPGKRGPKAGTEAAKRGGRAVAAKYGRDFYRQIGQKGGAVVKSKHGSEHYTRIGRQGGEQTKARHGSEHYMRIGHLGGLRRHDTSSRQEVSHSG